jgi:hypothetical protein
MGMIRGAIDKASSVKDIVSHGRRQGPGFAGDRTLPATGRECRDLEIDPGSQSDQALDSSRSRGYGRYEI